MRGVLVGVLSGLLLTAGCMQAVPDSGTAGGDAPERARPFAALFQPRDGGGDGQMADSEARRPAKPAKPLARLRVADGDIVIEPPDGYCVDPATAQARGQRGFALVASCRILSGGAVGDPVSPLIATVTVGPRADVQELPSPQALAQAADAPLLAGQDGADLVTAHLGSGGKAGLADGDDRYWRGAFVQAGRLVGLALYAPEGSPLAGPEGAAMLARIKARITARSPGGSHAAAPPPQPAPKGGGGLLGRLFNRQDLP